MVHLCNKYSGRKKYGFCVWARRNKAKLDDTVRNQRRPDLHTLPSYQYRYRYLGYGYNWLSGSGLEIRIRIQPGQKWPPEKEIMNKFHAWTSFLWGFMKTYTTVFDENVSFFNKFCHHKSWSGSGEDLYSARGWKWISIRQHTWIRIRIQGIRIRNTASYMKSKNVTWPTLQKVSTF